MLMKLEVHGELTVTIPVNKRQPCQQKLEPNMYDLPTKKIDCARVKIMVTVPIRHIWLNLHYVEI